MAITVDVNGVPIQYPQTGDIGWGDNATKFAEEVASVLGKIGQSQAPVNDDIIVSPGNLSVTTGNLSVGGTTSLTGNVTLTNNLTVNGNTLLGNANTDTIGVTGIVNVDSGTLYVDPINNRVGINDTTPSEALDVTGNVAITGNETVGGTLGVTGDVSVNTNKFNITAASGNTTIAGTLGVTGDVAINTNKFNVTASSGNTTIAGTLGVTGQALASDGTASAPGISFSGDTNTGLFRSASDQLSFATGGVERFRIESTGQIKAVYESTLGTDYNTTLANGYLCRAWVNFDGTSSNLTGTYSRTGTTITVSITSHGLTTGQSVYLDFTTGTATDGIYIVTVVNANSYTVTDTVSGSTSGNVTQFRYIRASGNVSSITDNGTGDYTVNFTTAMPDANYSAFVNAKVEGSLTWYYEVNNSVPAKTINSYRIHTQNSTPAQADASQISIGVFR